MVIGLDKDYEYWKNYRIKLTNMLKEDEHKLEKTKENIIKKAKEIGIKPTARYFNITPSQVRYFIKKYDDDK